MKDELVIGIPYTGCPYQSEVPATSESEAVAFAVGWILGGGKAEVFMQDCGWLTSLNIYTTLLVPYEIIKELKTQVTVIDTPEHHAYSAILTQLIYQMMGWISEKKISITRNGERLN